MTTTFTNQAALLDSIKMMQSAESLQREIGFQRLRPLAFDYAQELTALFEHTSDPNLRYRLFILLVESKSPIAQASIQEVLNNKDHELARVYDTLTGKLHSLGLSKA